MKEGLTAVLVVAVVVGSFFLGKAQNDGPEPLGRDFYNVESFKGGLVEGGVLTIATTSSAMTLTNADMSRAKVISIVASTSIYSPALALTLPASSTWTGLSANGDTQSWIIDNNHTAAATTTTVTAGTGVDLDGVTANDDVLNGGVSGELTCWRLPTSDIRCIVQEYVDAG